MGPEVGPSLAKLRISRHVVQNRRHGETQDAILESRTSWWIRLSSLPWRGLWRGEDLSGVAPTMPSAKYLAKTGDYQNASTVALSIASPCAKQATKLLQETH